VTPADPADRLRAEDVSFAYLGAARAALRHVNLAVAPGEVVLITGASGCGKSTLALALCGLIPARVHGELRGQVMFGGAALSGMKPHEASQLVGMVFQNPNLQLITRQCSRRWRSGRRTWRCRSRRSRPGSSGAWT
jgi:energy-coupling factor transport system ATP-binding protein